MATVRGNPRLQVGSAAWVAEERSSALQIAETETEEFSFAARNDVDWLNEHMAEIFSKNQVNVAEIFKTPGKLRGKTPRTARKLNPLEIRAPLSDVFSATPRGAASPFKHAHFERRVPTFHVAEDKPVETEPTPVPTTLDTGKVLPPKYNLFDSGYYGSQSTATQSTQPNELIYKQPTPQVSPRHESPARLFPPQSSPGGYESDENVVILGRDSEERGTTEGSFESAKEEVSRSNVVEPSAVKQSPEKPSQKLDQSSQPILHSPLQSRSQRPPSPQKQSPQRSSPAKEHASIPAVKSPSKSPAKLPEPTPQPDAEGDEQMEDAQSPSEGSSPIRPIVRKSSLNFASLPAREPITTKKSLGNRVSRTSQLEQSRTSYYPRSTGGKSLGNIRPNDDDDEDEMDVDGPDAEDNDTKMARLHNKTSTQRLQDQISMLGQSQTGVRPSKSTGGGLVPLQTSQLTQQSQPPQTQEAHSRASPKHKSPQHISTQQKERPPPTPGAFPDDEDDSWIGPPTATFVPTSVFSPRPAMVKSHTTDVMEGIHGKDSIAGPQFNIPKRGEPQRHVSPVREPLDTERPTTSSTLGHFKSVSTSVLRSPRKAGDSPGSKKTISVSNPNPSIHSKDEDATPPKSPARSYRGSPLKAAKDKFSSILKTSRGLFASSAAVSAEAKSSTLTPGSSRLGLHLGPSFEDALSQINENEPNYPNLDAHNKSSQHSHRPGSPFKSSPRKTRASTEREERQREEEAREAKEAKIAKENQKMEAQLEKARNKAKEDARVFHLEQERVAAMQKQVAEKKEHEKQAKTSQLELPRATRSSPRKTKAQLEAEGIAAAAASTDELSHKDVEMSDESQAMPPPPRPKSQIGRPVSKRPLKPAKEPVGRAKPPTVIRVDTGSQRGHQYHPSNSTLSATLQESLASSSQQSGPSQGLRHKASTSSIQSKASTNSFKSTAARALESAARKKEQDELAAQRKREAKQELERQRAAIKEEERRKEEEQRRKEAERQREVQRERERAASAAEAKKAASRQAIEKRRLEMEKAKETRAPPPAIRPQPSSDLRHAGMEKALPPVPFQNNESHQSKPPRLVNPSGQSQQDVPRPATSSLHHTTKAPPKRPLQQDSEEHHSRPTLQRNGPSYQQNEHHSKRRRTSEDFDSDDDMPDIQPKMTAPPIRQSSVRQKDVPTKSLFPSGYANAPQPANLQRSTVMSQHNMNQAKPAHPMDMAQVSKAPIPFASISNQANQHKTPARPGVPNGTGKSAAKSAAKSSPRYQNGENIDLPEIHTDSEDESSDDGSGKAFQAPNWTNSPDLRKQLAFQEGVDPSEVFGQPAPLNMEEVFSKSKDRFHKFRARTSSANWSGQDRLTDEEIKKDLEARDRVRRQGGWTYDSMV